MSPRSSSPLPYLPDAMCRPPPLSPHARVAPPTRGLALLINPFYPKDPCSSFGKHVLTPTLALTSVAATTPADWQVRVWDENLLHGPPPSDPFPELVGITVHLTFAERAYALARWYRARGAKVVLGGLHVEACSAEAAPHADALAFGEGAAIWPTILADQRRGRLGREYRGSYRAAFDALPRARRDLLPRASFLTRASIIATRGCQSRCDFCYLSTDGLSMPYRVREPAAVADEIAASGEPYAVFTDNNLACRRDYLRALCAALEPLGIIWSAAVSIDVTQEPDLVRQMALSGCSGVFVGFESLEEQNLADARKRHASRTGYAEGVRVFHDHGIQVNGSFVFGFDHDRADVFARTVSWIEQQRLECATFHILTPYPGTPLFRRLEQEGRLLHRDWSRYDTAHAVFQPQHMSPSELEEGYVEAYRSLFSHRSIWRRRPAETSAVPAYLAMAYLYKRSNWLWHALIKGRLVHACWAPLVELSRRRHLSFRRRLRRRVGATMAVAAQRTTVVQPSSTWMSQSLSLTSSQVAGQSKITVGLFGSS